MHRILRPGGSGCPPAPRAYWEARRTGRETLRFLKPVKKLVSPFNQYTCSIGKSANRSLIQLMQFVQRKIGHDQSLRDQLWSWELIPHVWLPNWQLFKLKRRSGLLLNDEFFLLNAFNAVPFQVSQPMSYLSVLKVSSSNNWRLLPYISFTLLIIFGDDNYNWKPSAAFFVWLTKSVWRDSDPVRWNLMSSGTSTLV